MERRDDGRVDEPTVAIEPYANAAALVAASVAEMSVIYGSTEAFDEIRDVSEHEFERPDGAFVVARLDGVAVACGGFRRFDERSAEVKRMYTDPSVRGRKMARRVLEALERAAQEAGYRRIVLETGTLQPHAVALYRSMGYLDMPCYGEYVEDPYSVCFEKELA